MELPHWAVFILIAVVATLGAELIKPDFVEKMKTGRGRVYLAQQLIVGIIGALLLSIVTDDWKLAAITFGIAKAGGVLEGVFTRALLIKDFIEARKSEDALLPIDQPTLSRLPIVEKVLTKMGIQLHETRLDEKIDEMEAAYSSRDEISARVASQELGIPPDDIEE